jgi:hypothetical protein
MISAALFRCTAAASSLVLFAVAAGAATEVVTGAIECPATAPRTATMNGTNGLFDREFVCRGRSSRAGGDCTEQIRDDLDDRDCEFTLDQTGANKRLFFACTGSRQAMVAVVGMICQRLNGL